MVRACDEKRRVRRKEGDGYRSARKQERKTEEEVWADCVKDDLREKGLSGEEVYDRAAWRRLSSHIDPT